MFRHAVASWVGNAVLAAMLNQIGLHQFVLAAAQQAASVVETRLVAEDILHLAEAHVVVVFVHQQMAEQSEQHAALPRKGHFEHLPCKTDLFIRLEQLIDFVTQILR